MELEDSTAALDAFGASGEEEVPAGSPLVEHIDGDSRSDASRVVALLKELGLRFTEESLVLMPELLSFLKHDDPDIVRQTIASGTRLFCAVLEEMALQLERSGKVERWLDKMWAWMVQFKDAVSGIVLEHGSVGTRVLAVKFLEICVLLFTSDEDDNDGSLMEGKGQNFNVSRLVRGHPILNPILLAVEANRTLGFLLDILQSVNTLRGSFTITAINCLAAIAKNRRVHYNRILSSLLGIDTNFETLTGGHASSIRYSLRTAFLGFLRCTHPSMVESREKLLRALQVLNPGEAADQIIRQVEKMSKNMERVSRDTRLSKVDLLSGQLSTCGDIIKKRSVVERNDALVSDDMPAKRTCFKTSVISTQPAHVACDMQDDDASNDFSSKSSLIDSNLTPAEKMITMIGALLAEGERGAESLELLISNIHADLLADIVIETMKHLPKSPLDSSNRHGNMLMDSQASSSIVSLQIESAAFATDSTQSSVLSSQLTSTVADASGSSILTSDTSSSHSLLSDSKRDPRRDPRRIDPRRAAEPVSQPSVLLNSENKSEMHSGPSHSLNIFIPASELIIKVENSPLNLMPKKELELSETAVGPIVDKLTSEESLEALDVAIETEASLEVLRPSNLALSPVNDVDEELAASNQPGIAVDESLDGDILESDQYSSSVSTTFVSGDSYYDLPMLPVYVDLMDDQNMELCKLAVVRIIQGYQQIRATRCGQARLPILARLVAQTDADDNIITLLQKHIILDYHHHKGHELAMHVLYYLRTIIISESDEYSSFAANNYEKFLLAVAKALLDSLPASDKSFSRLLGEAPFLPDSALRLLEDLCHLRYYGHHYGKYICDGDRVTQGLGAVWSLILGRPLYRKACLDIALKCAVHSLDEVRTKAIRLVANKLYLLDYVSENIERFAIDMLFSVVDQQELKLVGVSEQIESTASQETSISGSQNSEPAASESESAKGIQAFQSIPTMSLSHAQQQTSLFFALCTKKESLLQIIFDIYGRAPRAVKQSVHRHVPILVRALGTSFSGLLRIISNPPEGSENLILLVLQILTEKSSPTDELIAAVKHLYETKLKDAAILIPMLSSLSKDEVLPIFPRLVDLPLEKFLAALARILQGSAHTGPALTPVEVLVAIHDIDPEKDGVALKKITDACTACFEQRTVFTQHVLEKSLSHMVDRVPLPLLFMRTVIQAIDAFPTLVDFVMGILSKLVNKQIWKMPKLWVGFLKCASQTQPHSFHVLLQLPPPQLESALSRYTNLKGPLAAFANQSNTRTSLSRHTLRILGLGLVSEQQAARSYLPAALHASDAGSSVHGATLT